jgi:carboxyl-terminal processing protease
MLPATNRGVGMNIGFPDVCLTPVGPAVVPIPYPNFALTAQAAAFSPVVRVSGVNALNLGSMIPMTFGDDAGVAHWSVKGPGRYVMGNPIVSIDRLPAINLTCLTTGNTGNNAVGAVLVPSATNVFYCYVQPLAHATTSNVAATLSDDMLGRTTRPSVSCTMVTDRVGLVRVEIITSDISRRFHVALLELQRQNAHALLIDLRGCPGGDLDAAIEWAACFLNEGDDIARIEDAEGDEIVRRTSLPPVYTMPLAILVDEETASAAEIVVTSLQAHGRASIIGRSTYGKTTVQHFVPDQTSFSSVSTVARWSGPGNISMSRGVLPDRNITSTAEESEWFDAALMALNLN